ncbi:YdaE family protein [Escherichia coli]|nr:YdaE family protein [Escherichia coli]
MTKKIKCAYHLCNKEVEESKIIDKTTSLHARGVIPTTEMKKYCSEICAEKDQMAHEL